MVCSLLHRFPNVLICFHLLSRMGFLHISPHLVACYKLIQAADADVGSNDLCRALLQSCELATFFEEVEAGPEAEFLGTLFFDVF